jgi:CheY-like chemotaxis protein
MVDRMLPDLNGLEVCRRLRAEPATANTPIIMLSAAEDDTATMDVMRAAGVNRYIPKPIEWDRLKREIETLFSGWQAAPGGASASPDSYSQIGAWHRKYPEVILPQLNKQPKSEWPRILAGILRDRESPARGKAVVALAAWGREVNALYNHTPGQQFFWEYVRHSLASSTTDDAEKRWAQLSLVAYALMQPPEQLDDKLEYICRNTKNPECHQWALRILIENKSPQTIELAGEALGNWNSDVRATAALALATLGTTQHVPLLTQALSDPSPGVREQAANALVSIGSDISQIALETALLEGVPEAAEAAANALASIATPDAIEALLQAAADRTEPAVLCQVAHALGKIKTNKCRVALWKLSKHENELVSKAASLYV